jgi:hypothetical protein
MSMELAGRTVFFFTGELRKSSAEATAESLRALGADEIRTFCLRQGSHGPEAYPRTPSSWSTSGAPSLRSG